MQDTSEDNVITDKEENRRVLRKTSREPTISPTKARSILSGKSADRVYPIRTELERSPVMMKPPESAQWKSPSKKIMKTPIKSPQLKQRNTAERSKPKSTTPSKKELKNSATKSDRKNSDSKQVAKKKEEKPKNAGANDVVPKRKLSFEEKPKDVKKAKVLREEKQENQVSQRPKRRSRTSNKEEEKPETHDIDIGNYVSLEDAALFEEAQKMLDEDAKVRLFIIWVGIIILFLILRFIIILTMQRPLFGS